MDVAALIGAAVSAIAMLVSKPTEKDDSEVTALRARVAELEADNRYLRRMLAGFGYEDDES